MSKVKNLFKFRRSTVDLSEWSKLDAKLATAVDVNNLEKIDALLNTRSLLPTKLDPNGSTVFHTAASRGQIEVVNLLLAFKADTEALDAFGRTALSCAAVHGHPRVAEQLLQANNNCNSADNNGYTSLHHACDNGHVELARLLLANDANIDARTKDSQTSLLLAAENGNLAVCKLLLEKNCDVNWADSQKRTPLMKAIECCHVDVCELLVKAGANTRALDVQDHDALWFAQQIGNMSLVKLVQTAPLRASHLNSDEPTQPSQPKAVGPCLRPASSRMSLLHEDVEIPDPLDYAVVPLDEVDVYSDVANAEETKTRLECAEQLQRRNLEIRKALEEEQTARTQLEVELQNLKRNSLLLSPTFDASNGNISWNDTAIDSGESGQSENPGQLVTALRDRIARLTRENDGLIEKLRRLMTEDDGDDLKPAIDIHSHYLETSFDDQAVQIDELEGIRKQLMQNLSTATQKKEALESELQQRDCLCEKLKTKIQALEKESESAKVVSEETAAKFQQLLGEQKQMEEEMMKIQSSLFQVSESSSNGDSDDAAERLRTEIVRLEDELGRLDSSNRELSGEVCSLKETNQELAVQVARSNSEISRLNKDIAERTMESHDKTAQTERLLRENNDLELRLIQTEEELDVLRQEIEARSSSDRTFEDENANREHATFALQLEQENEDLKRENTALVLQLKQLQQNLEQAFSRQHLSNGNGQATAELKLSNTRLKKEILQLKLLNAKQELHMRDLQQQQAAAAGTPSPPAASARLRDDYDKLLSESQRFQEAIEQLQETMQAQADALMDDQKILYGRNIDLERQNLQLRNQLKVFAEQFGDSSSLSLSLHGEPGACDSADGAGTRMDGLTCENRKLRREMMDVYTKLKESRGADAIHLNGNSTLLEHYATGVGGGGGGGGGGVPGNLSRSSTAGHTSGMEQVIDAEKLHEENIRLANLVKVLRRELGDSGSPSIEQLQGQLKEADRRHRQIVSTYRSHLLNAVQGAIEPEISQVLRHIIHLREAESLHS